MANVRYERPSGLGHRGAAIWDSIFEMYGDKFLPSDRMLVEDYCKLLELWSEARDGLMSKNDRWGATRHREIRESLDWLASSLGLTPKDRKNLEMEVQSPEQSEEVLEKKRRDSRPRTQVDSLTPEALGLRIPESSGVKQDVVAAKD